MEATNENLPSPQIPRTTNHCRDSKICDCLVGVVVSSTGCFLREGDRPNARRHTDLNVKNLQKNGFWLSTCRGYHAYRCLRRARLRNFLRFGYHTKQPQLFLPGVSTSIKKSRCTSCEVFPLPYTATNPPCNRSFHPF